MHPTLADLHVEGIADIRFRRRLRSAACGGRAEAPPRTIVEPEERV
jgi:hypothetical protein